MKKLFLSLTAVAVIALTGCNDPKDEPKNNMDCSLPANVEAVDLGLPSGIKWANMNIGADTPEGYGNYFAWGDTSPKNVYNWTTYKWYNGDSNALAKYGGNSGNGYSGVTDGKTILDPEDDAAHVNWGGDWRMPTREEMDELCSECYWTMTKNYNGTGIAGNVVSSKTNGNSIFLPASGYRNGSALGGVGTHGYYWTSSLGENRSYDAVYLYFLSDYVERVENYRYYGISVRPVCK